MKPALTKTLFFLFYITLLLWIVKFDFMLILNIKSFCVVVLGTALLTLFGYKKSSTKSIVIDQIKWNLQLTGYLTTFMSQMAFLSEGEKLSEVEVFMNICLNFVPLVYSYLIYVLVDFYGNSIQTAKSHITDTSLNEIPLNIDSTVPRTALQDAQLINAENVCTFADKAYIALEEYNLTKTEKTVSEYILKGLSNKEIAETLYISENTVKKHIQNILKKTDTKNRSQFICKITIAP